VELQIMTMGVNKRSSSERRSLDCLLVQQPYASLIAFGKKRWEFRSYETKKRGTIGIAASPSSVFLTHDVSLNSISNLFPRGVLLATANLTNCFYATGADLKKAMTEQIRINMHGHEIFTLDSPIGEPMEDVQQAAYSDSWESYVWELSEVNPTTTQIPVIKNPRSTWVKVDYGDR
jgi:hypothetical protein